MLSVRQVMMNPKSSYNERFSFSDPSVSACRATRHRAAKRKRLQDSTSLATVAAGTDDVTTSIDLSQTEISDALPIANSVAVADNEDNIEDILNNIQQQNIEEEPVDLNYEDIPNCVESLLLSDNEFKFNDRLLSSISDDHINDECTDSEQPIDAENIPYSHHFMSLSSNSTSPAEPLYEGSSLTSVSSSVLLMKYAMKHNLTREALADLLDLTKLHCPLPNTCPSSLHLFEKHFKEMDYKATMHFFCSNCLQEMGETKICENHLCDNTLQETETIPSFIELPIDMQIKSILEREGLLSTIQQCNRVHIDGQQMTDVYSGVLYQQHVATGFLANPNNISLIFNTDGLPVFKSSKFSFWPLYLLINELPYKMRITKENRILAGLWYGSIKPNMSIFLKPMAKAIKEIQEKGVPIVLPNSSTIYCHAMLLCSTCDLPARALVMNMTQFNGFFGCCHCLQKGASYSLGGHSHTHIYSYDQDNPTGPKRDHKTTYQHMKDAISTSSTVFGIKGPSWLCIIPLYDFIDGMSIDYMHCVLLGVGRLLLKIWIQSSYHQELWYIGNQVKSIDERLCSITPPDEIQRTPRSIELTVKFWKAHELRAWILHYSVAVLYGILPNTYYQHHLLLVEAIFLLLQEKISSREIDHSLELIKHYCFLFGTLYGEQHMTMNVHNLLHLPQVVRNLGPLWSHSCFPFESANGHMLKLFHGSQAVEKQVIRHISEIHKLPSLAKSSLTPGSQQEGLFKKMSHLTRRQGKAAGKENAATVYGKPQHAKLTTLDASLFQNAGINIPSDEAFFWPFLNLSYCVISAQSKSKSTKRNNSCVLYSDRKNSFHYGMVEKLVSFSEDSDYCSFAIITEIVKLPPDEQICHDNVTSAQLQKHLAVCHPLRSSYQKVILTKNIVNKCIFMNLSVQVGLIFVSQFPNFMEVD